MSPSDVVGIIFPNTHDKNLGEMTSLRAVGSLPFCGRYRLIDFSLSNLVNAGVANVGVIARGNYQSLIDHLGSGRSWDLARRNGGLMMITPYSNRSARVYEGKIDALAGAMHYLEGLHQKYVILCDANLVSSINLEDVVNTHRRKAADVTVCYTRGVLPRGDRDVMALTLGEDGFATKITLPVEQAECDYGLDVIVIERELLIRLVKEADSAGKKAFAEGIILPNFGRLKILGYKVDGFTAVIDSEQGYYNANMRLLRDPAARDQLFRAHPVYTKVRDDMPTKYGLRATVEDALIADGCDILGDVKGCVLSRGVKVGEGATLRGSIIMQDADIGEGCEISYAILDKNVRVSPGVKLRGTESHPVYISKGEILQ